ncbi:transcriptional regulator [Streptomyces collinus]|uniref:transcriptional regulator n=1 Tax=Streptomyces collinus TaxID=42684 RepID=UPI0036BF1568
MARSESGNGHSRNEALWKLLDQLEWSVRGFASRVHQYCQAAGIDYTGNPGTVSRWCANKTVPSPPLATAACYVLSDALRQPVRPESLGWPAHSPDIAVESLEYLDVPHAVRVLAKLWDLDARRDRRLVKKTFFAGVFGAASREALVMPPDADLSGRGGYKVSVADIELLDDQTALYGRLDARHGGGRFRSVFAAFLSAQAVPLLRGSFTARLGRRLYGSVTDAVLAMASMAYDDQLPGLAQRYDLQAMRLAQAIGDRARIARVHIHQARLAASQGDRREVLTHARSAVLACDGAPPLVRSYAAITEARAWAFNGDAAQTLDAVTRARESFGRASPRTDPPWLAWFDEHELEGQAAWAFAVAGLVEPGAQALKAAMDMPSDRTRDNVELLITAAELARVQGDFSEHAAQAQRAADLARGLTSRRLAARIERLAVHRPLDDF